MRNDPPTSTKAFPTDFVWGTATSCYQIEGAVDAGHRGPSIWDAFASIPGRTSNGDTGAVATDHYHKFLDDVRLMSTLGIKAYRFSISWPRIQPDGKGTEANEEGVAFYTRLIDALLEHNIEPWATLYHWDMPLNLEMEEDGWRNPRMAEYFRSYANLCFKHFGGKVKRWITLNEPWVVAICGHGLGVHAPGRKSMNEPYVVGHTLLRAHAYAVDCYRTKYQADQGGLIGITNNCDWREPFDSTKRQDVDAAQRALEFFLGWFADPIFGTTGDYPAVMRERLGDRLPEFTEEDTKLLMGSSDFFGLNHYSTNYVEHCDPGAVVADPCSKDESAADDKPQDNAGLVSDQSILLRSDPRWSKTDMGWNVVPQGLTNLLRWIHHRYDAPTIYITENGCAYDDGPDDASSSSDGRRRVRDERRVDYYRRYISACRDALDEGVVVKGYFAWSLLDNFEWSFGYDKRFGLVHVDYDTLDRTPKDSFAWYGDVIRNNRVVGKDASSEK